MKRRKVDLRSLSAQMILSSVGLVLLMAAAAGVPAIWLIRGQLERQAWAQVEQGSIAAQSLYAAQERELASLATLTAQRPMLSVLLAQGDEAELEAYLLTLVEGAGLDLVLVCDSDLRAVAQVGPSVPGGLCERQSGSGLYVVEQGESRQAWMYAAHSIPDIRFPAVEAVLVGRVLDDLFATEMASQTGLGHTLLLNGQPLASSLAARGQQAGPVAAGETRGAFQVDGRPYYTTLLPLDAPGLQAEVALAVAEIADTQRTLVWTLVGSIGSVAVVASLLGIVLARRIGQPLAHLAEAAGGLSTGELDSPLTVSARVREVTLLAQALEGARADLRQTLVELRREKAWADHLLEAIVEGVVTLDRQGHITFFSQGAQRISGWKREEVLGRSCDQVFKPIESDAPFSELIPAPGRRQKIPVETRDGRQAILAVTGARLMPPEGGEARVALVFRDITEEEAVHRLLGHFLANVAHEFRTPLSALAASVELLLDQARDLRTAEIEELLTSLHLGVLGLQTLIDNLLESASIETGHFRVQPRPSSLADIIADAVATMQPLLEKHGQNLLVDLPAAIPVVQADPRRTVQVLTNLLSNASKYSPDDTEIKVGVVLEGRWAVVSVADQGPGVPPEYRQDLFRRFRYTKPGNTTAQVGAGLGLSVVKAIAEAHGGAAGADDGPAGGLVIWFTLPVAGS